MVGRDATKATRSWRFKCLKEVEDIKGKSSVYDKLMSHVLTIWCKSNLDISTSFHCLLEKKNLNHQYYLENEFFNKNFLIFAKRLQICAWRLQESKRRPVQSIQAKFTRAFFVFFLLGHWKSFKQMMRKLGFTRAFSSPLYILN